MRRRAVVLGGVGLVGTHLCRRLLDEGYDVVCVDVRGIASSSYLFEVRRHSRFRFVNHNIINGFNIHCDEIYNLTAPVRLQYDEILPVEAMKLSALGLINTLEAARAEHARVVHVTQGGGFPLTAEQTETGKVDYNASGHMFTEGQRASEVIARAYKREYSTDVRVARLYNCYGLGADMNDQRVVIKMILQAIQGRNITIYGSGRQVRTLCWANDVADGLWRLMNAPESSHMPVVDVGSNQEISILDLAHKIIALTNSDSIIEHTEPRVNDQMRKIPDLHEAYEMLGWLPYVGLDDGLRQMIEYVDSALVGASINSRSWSNI